MQISKVIEKLQEMREEHGDIEVRLNCDHGQECMSVTSVCTAYIEEDSYMPEYQNDEIEDYIKVIEIQAY